MSRVLQFPKFAGPPLPPRLPTNEEQLLAMLDAARRDLRRAVRKQKRYPMRAARRAIISIGRPPHDPWAVRLWGFALAMMLNAEWAFRDAADLCGTSEKTLRGYLRRTRKAVADTEKAARRLRVRMR